MALFFCNKIIRRQACGGASRVGKIGTIDLADEAEIQVFAATYRATQVAAGERSYPVMAGFLYFIFDNL